jgi:HEAT repeat protein
VLRTAADPEQRQIAAELLGYAPNKRDVVPDLVEAVRDPDEGVRNNATRALWAIAVLGQRKPELGIRIDATPFITMLNSLVWSDRNKAAAVLSALTAGRATPVLARLRRQALPALVEMARWKSAGHAQAPFILLGRLAGLEEAAIGRAWTSGEREAVIARALESARPPARGTRPLRTGSDRRPKP